MEKIPLLALVGPTGIGKSRLAQTLALQLDTSIIHADSRQVYKKMDIGTAKPSQAMCRAVPHYMLDIVEPDEDFNAGRYSVLAAATIENIFKQQKLPIVEGGSGLYIRALIDGLFNGPPADIQIRQRLKDLVSKHGISFLHQKLEQVDSETAARLHPNDTSRIIRALEVYQLTGKPLSSMLDDMPPSPYEPVIFGLTAERSLLYKWIEERSERMFEEGFIEEVKRLLAEGYSEDLNSMQGLGYREVIGYLNGSYDLDQALDLLKRDTRRYAKRQLTWFRQDKRIQWLEVSHPSKTEVLAPHILHQIAST